MATSTITGTSINHTSSNIKKAAVILSDGRGITAVMRSLTTVALYYRTTDSSGSSWSEALTFTITGAKTGTSLHAMVMSPDEDNLYFIWLTSTNTIRCRRINISGWTIGGLPSTQWVVVAEEAVLTSANIGGTVVALDADVSDLNAVLVSVLYNSTTTNDRVGWVVALRDTAAVWHFSIRQKLDTGNPTPLAAASDISVSWYRNSGTRRRFSVFSSWGTTTASKGTQWYHNSIKESDGTLINTVFKRQLLTTNAAWGTWTNGPPQRSFSWQTSDTALNEQILALSMVGVAVSGYVYPLKIITLGTSAADDVVDTPIFPAGGTISTTVQTTTPWKMSATYSRDLDNNHIVNFLAPTTQFSDSVARMRATVVSMGPLSVLSGAVKINNSRTVAAGDWDYPNVAPSIVVPTSHAPSFLDRSHAVLVFTYSGTTGTWAYSRRANLLTPSSTSPSTSEIIATSEPTFSMNVTPQSSWGGQAPPFIPVVQVAQDNSFTVASQTVSFSEKLFAPSIASFSQEWPGLDMAPSDTWYHRIKTRDLYGNESGWSTTRGPWKIRHPMSADLLNLSSSGLVPFAYSDPMGVGYTEITIAWKAVDAWWKDFQTKYKVIVGTVDTGVTIFDSGEVTSSETSAVIRVPFEYASEDLLLIVSLWDSFGTTVNTLDSIASIVVYEPPVISDVSLVSVDGDGFADSNKPIFSYIVTGNLYPLLQLVWIIAKGSTTVGFGIINNPTEVGVIDTATALPPYDVKLENLTDYTMRMVVVDTNMLASATTGDFPFTTKWAPPTPPTGVSASLAEYNTENGGSVLVQWNGFDASDDFMSWNVYRVVDLLDAAGNVVESGELELIYSDGGATAIMTYRDYFAPSGHRVGYVVRQVVNMFGSVVESVNDVPAYVLPVSDGYWLIDPTPEDDTASAFKLHNVTGDSYQHEYEEEVIHVIGKGRHVDRGDDLGVSGSLTCQIRDTGLTTARQKKLRLEKIKKEVRSLFLRTPFGDAWFVSVGNMDIARIAGVGSSEFIDVTIPYIEVYQ